MATLKLEADEAQRLTKLRRRVDQARKFPTNTCPASRHLHLMADCLSKRGVYHMLQDEPVHCAESIYATIQALWEARTEINALKHDLERAMKNHNADLNE